ncbi:Heat shock 70 kDa protein 12B, partial [Aptenodytes forsteri]
FAVVVAIDFGTTSSGYAFSFSSDPEAIHMMRKWEGGDPGVANQKTPTSLLLTPEGVFHSFGYTARDYYHDLDPEEARDWLYFEKFKMKIHSTSDLTMKTELEAVNGKKMQALEVFAHALRFFKQHAVQELKDQCPSLPERDAIRWVITVPAIWKQPAKQFMREAAYKAGLVSPENPEQLLIALEPEAASIYCRKLRLHQLIDLSCKPPANGLAPDHSIDSSFRQGEEAASPRDASGPRALQAGRGEVGSRAEQRDGWTSSSTVELGPRRVSRLEGSGQPVLPGLSATFPSHHLVHSKQTLQRPPPALQNFFSCFFWGEKPQPPHILVKAAFFFPGESAAQGLRPGGCSELMGWASRGVSPGVEEHRQPPALPNAPPPSPDDLLKKPEVQGIKFLFLVGGFAESAMLQHAVQAAFGPTCRVIIPQDVGLTILKGAVLFGLDPTIVRVRRSPLTYGVGVLNKFVEGKHPREKLLVKEGKNWCTDIFEKFVSVDQSVALGEVVQRSYCPARPGQRKTIINIYCPRLSCEAAPARPGVRKCGTISLELEALGDAGSPARGRRETRPSMQFGDTEIKSPAMDIRTSKTVRATI